jgi:tRNA G10  N-methylase Trm11
MEIEESDFRDFFRVCFSVVARRLSHADPSISVPVRIRPKAGLSQEANKAIRAHLRWIKSASAPEEFDKVVQANIARVLVTNRAFRARSRSVLAGTDARHLTFPDGRRLPSDAIQLTVTSPPYGSAQKYVRASSLSLNWLSMCPPSGLSDLEGRSIGREHLPARLAEYQQVPGGITSPLLDSTLSTIRARNPHRSAITETYLRELTEALREIVRVTAPGGYVVLVIGNNTVSGLPVRNDQFTTTIMQELGLELELALRDRIHSRGLLTARHSSAAPINGETILLFRK